MNKKKIIITLIVLFLAIPTISSLVNIQDNTDTNNSTKAKQEQINTQPKTSESINITREVVEVLLNNYTISTQQGVSICALSNDRFAAAWTSRDQPQDGDVNGVFASVFDATTGNNITNEFRVNYNTTSNQELPSICALSNDRFAVAWTSAVQDPDGSIGIYASVFDATTGANVTREFRVNYNITSEQDTPSICKLSNDRFAIAWASNGQDGDGYGIYASVFDATTGNNITNEFRVNYNTTNHQENPSICALSSDQFAVAWQSLDQDGDNYGVFARVFDATTGANVTREFRVNYNTTDQQRDPSITALSSDTFAAAWKGRGNGDDYGVFASIFDATTGNNITNEFRVNNYTTNGQQNPEICTISSSMFAVAWEVINQIPGPDDFGVFASVISIPSTSAPQIGLPRDEEDDDEEEEETLLEAAAVYVSTPEGAAVVAVSAGGVVGGSVATAFVLKNSAEIGSWGARRAARKVLTNKVRSKALRKISDKAGKKAMKKISKRKKFYRELE